MHNEQWILKPTPKIIFGVGRLRQLPEQIAAYGRRALLLTGESSLVESRHWEVVESELAGAAIHHVAEAVSGEPTPELIDDITSAHRGGRLDVVVGIGGGSVLDAGKAVSAMLACDGGVEEYLEGVGSRAPSGEKVPYIAVPTTAGTGSETTSNAVVSRVGPNGFKKSLRHDNYIPNIALIDPLLALEAPRRLTLRCAMDAFSQLVESYLSTKATPFTDSLARGALEQLSRVLLSLCKDGGGLEERSTMAYCACISGITLANAGLGVVHGFASVLGGRYPIPHGLVCGTLMAACNSATLVKLRRAGGHHSPALAKYAQLGRIFGAGRTRSDSFAQDFFIDFLKRMTEEGNLEGLERYGVQRRELPALARATGCKNNPVELDAGELEKILLARM